MKKQDFTPSPSFQAVSRASRSPPQGGSVASTMNATCGPKCCGSSGNCSPVGCLEKMLLASSVWGSTKRSLTWSRQVTMFGFSYYLLLPLARGTNGNGYSSSAPLLPTPLASDTGDVGKVCERQLSQDEQGWQSMDGAAFPCGLPDDPHHAGKALPQPGLGRVADGFPAQMDGHSLWAEEPADIPRLAEEVPNRSKRMKTLGNAVSPPQVFPILKYIADIETGRCPMGGEEL